MKYQDLLKFSIVMALFIFSIGLFNNYKSNKLIEQNINLKEDIQQLKNETNDKNEKIIKALSKIVEKQSKIDLSKLYNKNNIISDEDLSEHDKESRKKFNDLESRYLKKAFEEYEIIKKDNNNNN